MPWPLSQDYNEAIQSPASAFSDPELQAGEPVTNALGMPMPRSGNFADVYEFIGASGAKWAIKCFTREVTGLQERYHQIDLHLLSAKLPFTVGFQYQPGGIRIHGQWHPILKMQWVDGFLLNEFVRNNLDKPALLESLGRIWLRMAKRLREADLAHADLQHGNVLLVPGNKASSLAIKLIDYDGVWVPALARQKAGEVGHPAYQHPQRVKQGTYNAEVDRLPLLVVACALRCLMVGGKSLWDRYDNGDNLLFREADLKVPGKSPLFKELHELPDLQARTLAQELHNALLRKLEETPAIDELLSEPKPASVPGPPATVKVVDPPATLNPGWPGWDMDVASLPKLEHQQKVQRRGISLLAVVAGATVVAALSIWIWTMVLQSPEDRRATEWVQSIDGDIINILGYRNVDLHSNPMVSDEGLAHLKEWKNLYVLNLSYTKVSDAGLAHLKDCKNLQNLYLHGTKVSDAGLAHLKEWKNLARLDLSKSLFQISDFCV